MHAKYKGFTLIELLVVIAITAIMATIAFPNMSQWIASRRAANQAEQTANLLRFARSEAVRLNMPVYICPVQIKADGTSNGSCDTKYEGQGLLAYADKNGNNTYDNDKDDLSLRTIVLNGNGGKKVTHNFQYVPFGSGTPSEQLFWVFRPDGNFGHTDAKSAAPAGYSIADGHIKISMTDASASNDEQKKARSSVILVDPSGLVEICAKSDSRKLCTYP